MRSTTFDMIGMTLMAVVTIATSGGILTWSYLQQQRVTATPPSSEPKSNRRPPEGDRRSTSSVSAP